MEEFFNLYEKLVIGESEKLLVSLGLIIDYYFYLDGKNASEMHLTPLISIVKKHEILPLESNSSYPRIDKLYRNCIKLLFKYEEILKNIESKNKKSELNDTSTISYTKRTKTFSKKLHAQTETTIFEDKNNSYDEEMRTALKNEKTKFKFRMTQLKLWAENTLTKMRKLANQIYEKLDDWIILTIKTENEALNQVIKKLRDHVDRENKIRYIDFELDKFDIYDKITISLSENVIII
jgi:hypothetical protein